MVLTRVTNAHAVAHSVAFLHLLKVIGLGPQHEAEGLGVMRLLLNCLLFDAAPWGAGLAFRRQESYVLVDVGKSARRYLAGALRALSQHVLQLSTV